MKIKITTRCRNCIRYRDTEGEEFIFNTNVAYSNPGFKCSKCGASWNIKVEEYDC